MAKKKQGMQIFLGIGLAVLLFALVNLGTNAFYKSPDYNTYCGSQPMNFYDQTSCVNNGGKWYPAVTTNGANSPAYCDATYTCNTNYTNASNLYNNTIFYVFVILGLGIAVYGFFIKKKTFQITAIATGLALIIEGIWRNYQNQIPAFIAGLIAFAILVYFINKKFLR